MKRIIFAALFFLSNTVLLTYCSKPADEQAATGQQPAVGEEEAGPATPEPGQMALIPAGEFIMGSNEKMPGQELWYAPERKINLPAYYIDYYEVTYGEWIKFVTESGHKPESNWREFYSFGREKYPVSNITWDDAKAYAKWAGKRLPTEAEWEKAARGTAGLKYPWGPKWDPTKSNCNEMGGRTVEVGSMEYDKSPFGIYDMMGNIQEWTADMLKPYPGSPSAGDSTFLRGFVAVRGASYAMRGSSMPLWTRTGYFPKSQYGLGLRCVKDADGEKKQAQLPTLNVLALNRLRFKLN